MYLNIHWESCFKLNDTLFVFLSVHLKGNFYQTTITGQRRPLPPCPPSPRRGTGGGRHQPTESTMEIAPPYGDESASIGGPTTAPPPGRRRRSLVWTCPRGLYGFFGGAVGHQGRVGWSNSPQPVCGLYGFFGGAIGHRGRVGR